jgi:hypothetical protein
MASIRWPHNVSYNPSSHSITFFVQPKQGNTAISLIDYYRELYPKKSWLELAMLAIPELAGIQQKERLKFYATTKT